MTVIPLFFATNGINGTVLIEPNTDSLELTDCEEVTAASVNDGTQLSAVITTDSSSCNAAGHDDDQTALIVGIVVPIVCVCCCCVFILLVVALATALLPRSHRLFDATSDQDGSEVARRDSVGWEETTRGVEVCACANASRCVCWCECLCERECECVCECVCDYEWIYMCVILARKAHTQRFSSHTLSTRLGVRDR